MLTTPSAIATLTTTQTTTYNVRWEKLPDDFLLPDDPVDNINQPALAAALTESLQLSQKLSANALTPTNYRRKSLKPYSFVLTLCRVSSGWLRVVKFMLSEAEVTSPLEPDFDDPQSSFCVI